MSLCALAALLPLFLMGLTSSLWVLPAYALFYFVFAVLGVQIETGLQHGMEGNSRATALSLKSLVENLSGIVMIVFLGYIAKGFGLRMIWWGCGLYAAAMCLVFGYFTKGEKRLN